MAKKYQYKVITKTTKTVLFPIKKKDLNKKEFLHALLDFCIKHDLGFFSDTGIDGRFIDIAGESIDTDGFLNRDGGFVDEDGEFIDNNNSDP